ncbi:ATP-binding protein [Nocardioides sp. zg-579]|uniref:ATP-binding protein n=2 Tax=Nocardioides marmotae TaxID=2663857 RepID=A0A6I3J0N1_9ACTN|nr:ATP-binding protein [Gordonia jinghuaiqii]MTB94551.1 ATP-binding protein [Nocardioides marmotae]
MGRGTTDRTARSDGMGRQHDDETCVTMRLPYQPSSVRRARHLLTEDLRRSGLRESVVDDAGLVVSELLTNGLVHGRPNADERIAVSWCLRPDHLWLSVIDGGDVAELRPVDLNDHALSGRGLAIVDHVCESWRFDRTDGTRVTAELAYA